MSFSFHEIAQERASFQAQSAAKVGNLCYVCDNASIANCTDGSDIHGQVAAVRNGVASVTFRGFIYTKYTGEAPTLGYCPLVAHTTALVKVSEGAREYLVVSVDTTTKEICILL